MKIESPDRLPSGKHFAALVFTTKSIYHEGDERSRTHPGHGYGAYTETINSVEYIPFGNDKELEAWVLNEETSKTKTLRYRIIEATPISPKVTASVHFT